MDSKGLIDLQCDDLFDFAKSHLGEGIISTIEVVKALWCSNTKHEDRSLVDALIHDRGRKTVPDRDEYGCFLQN